VRAVLLDTKLWLWSKRTTLPPAWEVHDYSKEGAKVMSNNMPRLMGRAICLTILCLSLTLLAVAAGQTNITGTWKLNHLETDEPPQNARQIVGGCGGLMDSAADQRQTAGGIPYDGILLLMGGVSSAPEKLSVALSDSDITLSDRTGASLSLHTDGRVEKFRCGIQIMARWVNETLILATLSPQTSTKTAFTPARNGRRMLVFSEVDFPGAGPVVTRYLYDYESAEPTFSSFFWELHPPFYRGNQRQIEEWSHKSDGLLEQINKKIATAPISDGDIVDSLNAFLSD
jgi:hypothetical protein